MTMKTIGVYNLKGGVGKTTTAVNLAWCSANRSARRTLLWDLDPQGASTMLIGDGKAVKDEAQSIFQRDVSARKLVRASTAAGVDLIAADPSLRGLDRLFHSIGKRKRLRKLLDDLTKHYDRVILDCPPGLGETADQVLRGADLIVVPMVPTPLSMRAFDEVRQHIDREQGRYAPLMPVFTMVDRRRAMHKQALEQLPDWPTIPMASAIEKMAEKRMAIGDFAPRSPAALAYQQLWQAIEKQLADN